MQSEDERKLNEYLRQLKAPQVMQEKAPFITAASDPYAAHRTPDEIKNELGANVDKSFDPFNWLRNAERLGSSAVAKDYYNSRDAADLANKLNAEAGTNVKTIIDPNMKVSGQASDEGIRIKPESKYDDIDTVLHEFQHRKDYDKDPEAQSKINPNEDARYKNDPLGQYTAWKSGNLPRVESRITDRHFIQPGSASLNNFVDKTKDIAAQQGVMEKTPEGTYLSPDQNPKYQYLQSIAPTLKTLSGYDPNPQEPGMFDKLKQYLGQ